MRVRDGLLAVGEIVDLGPRPTPKAFGAAAESLFIGDHLRCRSATADSSCGELVQFNLGADFLDLRGLPVELGSESLYFFLLLCNRSLEVALYLFHSLVLFEEF